MLESSSAVRLGVVFALLVVARATRRRAKQQQQEEEEERQQHGGEKASGGAALTADRAKLAALRACAPSRGTDSGVYYNASQVKKPPRCKRERFDPSA